jgi:mannose-6-phosphate isomerase-like protein (cupin superfamily)
VDVPVGTAHRMANPGDTPLVFIEIQRGDFLGESDIVRLADDFGRAE